MKFLLRLETDNGPLSIIQRVDGKFQRTKGGAVYNAIVDEIEYNMAARNSAIFYPHSFTRQDVGQLLTVTNVDHNTRSITLGAEVVSNLNQAYEDRMEELRREQRQRWERDATERRNETERRLEQRRLELLRLEAERQRPWYMRVRDHFR